MKGFTLWFTGLSGSGKSTLASETAKAIRQRGFTKVEVLDGDVIRKNISKGLGFTKKDRDINVRRIGFICDLLTRNDVITIVAAISPYKELRDENRKLIGRFVEAYCQCPLETLKARDPKGLYERALKGEITHFTGVDDPYEPPDRAEIVCETDKESVEESKTKILATLEAMGYLPNMD